MTSAWEPPAEMTAATALSESGPQALKSPNDLESGTAHISRNSATQVCRRPGSLKSNACPCLKLGRTHRHNGEKQRWGFKFVAHSEKAFRSDWRAWARCTVWKKTKWRT